MLHATTSSTKRISWLISGAAAVLAAGVLFALSGSPFEAMDGDLVASSGTDWESLVGNPRLFVGNDTPSGQTDDSLRGKEDDVVPGIDFGSIPSNKSDLLRFYTYHERVVSESGPRDYLYLGWVRLDTLGTANMDFEFNQSSVLTENGSTVERTPGDMLVLYGFTGGSSQVTLGLSRWTATGPCEASSSAPCWGPVLPLTGFAEGAVNTTAPAFDPVSGTTLPALTFGEAAIDLTAAGVFDTDACVSFGRAFMKSRSSNAFTASLKDFIRPIDVRVSNCGTVTVRKHAVPQDAQDFSFTATPDLGASSFDLDDDGYEGNALPSARSFTGRFQGSYEITEAPATDWDLTDVTCTGASTPQHNGSGALTGASVEPAVGETVDCTFTNTKRGVIRVLQSVAPAGDPQPFDFQLAGGPDDVQAAFSLVGGGPAYVGGSLRPGTYAIAQTDPGEAWDLSSATCDDGSPVGAVTVAPGEVVTCTFINVKRGQIVVDETTVPAADPQSFPFALTGGPDALSDTFALTDAAAPHVSALVRPGTYAAAQSPIPAGWDLTSATCDDGSLPGAIQLNPGETVHCSFTHTRRATIVVDEITLPAGDPQLFSFALTGGPDAVNQSFGLADATAPRVSGAIKPGVYAIAQTPAGAAWDLSSSVCDNGSPVNAIQLAAGATVTCTFTNVKRGTITVDVVTTPSSDPQTFGFTLGGGPDAISQSFSLADATAPYASGLVRGGTYAATPEAAPAGWDFASASCSDGSAVGAIGLAAGENVTCTFSYVKRGRIRVDVVTTPSADPQVFALTLTGGPSPINASFSLSDTSALYDSGAVLPGTYAAAVPQVPSDWDLASSSCDDGSSPASIGVGAGETVTCTFSFVKRGRIIIDEVTIPSGDTQAFAFSLAGGPSALAASFSLTDAAAPYQSVTIRPGTYAASQTNPGGAWDLTSATCNDGSAPGAIDIAPGEVVTCTFTNTKRGQILIDKVTLPAGDPQSFSFTLSGGPDAIAQSFSLTDASSPRNSGYVRAGTYAAAEGALPANWQQTSATCSDGSAIGAIAVAPGETVTCTFTNTKRASLVIVKDARPNDPTDFAFSISGSLSQSFMLDDDADPALPNSSTFSVLAGNYVVTESDPGTMWDNTGISCTSSQSSPSISVSLPARSATLNVRPGETLTCTFVNSMRGRIAVIKMMQDTTPGPTVDPTQIPFEFSNGWGSNFILKHLERNTSPWLKTDRSYTVTELPYLSWEASSVCVFPDGTRVTGGASITVTPPPGGEVVCTFTNAPPTIHPGSSGFWRNWRNHYTDEQFKLILVEALHGSPIYASLFDPATGALRPGAIAAIDAIYATGGDTDTSRLLKELTSAMLNIGVSSVNNPVVHVFQNNDDVTRDTMLRLSTSDEALVRALAPCDIAAGVRIGDVLDVAEATWSGDLLAGSYSFNTLTSGQQATLGGIFGSFNIGGNIVVDPDLSPRPHGLELGGAFAMYAHHDADGDGHGEAAVSQICATALPAGYTAIADDCDDAHATVYPGASELCDGLANNCLASGWPTVPALEADADHDGMRVCGGDCDDTRANVYPGASEACDGIRNNCNTLAWSAAFERDDDGDGFSECSGDCNDASPALSPAAVDICNSVDDNCDGLADNDTFGVDSDGDGRANACDNCRLVANPTQVDLDRDGVGDACDVCGSISDPQQVDVDSDGIGDACDNCRNTNNVQQYDVDGDRVGDACDNCVVDANTPQSDIDHDGRGDRCDDQDGVIYLIGSALGDEYVEWQPEAGTTQWNVYKGSLAVLHATGVYTQAPGSNAMADRFCRLANPYYRDLTAIPSGGAAFYLVTSINGTIESSLGTTSSDITRPNTSPCP